MPATRPDAARTLDQLVEERPALHGHATGDPVNWQLGDGLLRWLVRELPEEPTTLETGCGYSTIAFATISRTHTVISPVAAEHERVQAWCAAHGIGTDHVRFVAERSEQWLPRAALDGQLEPLDAVLVDGDHAYPVPAIDWYYSAGALSVGGLMVVDDVSIRACGDLRRFLEGEAGRWEVLRTIDDATVFRKQTSDVVDYRPWNQQPWNRQRPSLALRMASVRGTVRLRTRLRALLDRG
jgi:predicted O-methyltransferase YrrM